jgi:hypothetical protein
VEFLQFELTSVVTEESKSKQRKLYLYINNEARCHENMRRGGGWRDSPAIHYLLSGWSRFSLERAYCTLWIGARWLWWRSERFLPLSGIETWSGISQTHYCLQHRCVRPPLWSSGQSSWLHNGDILCLLWGTNWIYICYVEESRPPLWSSGQSSWLQNGDVLCFLW